ncbi:MAG: enhanced serine sensitivity protein SseB [Solobacterium sp.]|nr:enhanced serine sensitivity protein SseB [Solobacterium sp.]
MSKQKKKKKKTAGTPAPSGPVSNPALKEAMAALKEGNSPEKQKALQEALKEARLLAPCAVDGPVPEDGRPVSVRTNKVRFFLINTNDGKVFFPAFTDPEESTKFSAASAEKPALMVQTIKDYDRMMQDPKGPAQGVIINPGSDSLVIPPSLAALISGRIPVPVTPVPSQAPVNAVYSEPAVYPTKMVNVLYDWCCEKPAISRVWLKQKMVGIQMSFFLGVEADTKDPALLQEMIEVCVPHAKDIPVEPEFVTEHLMKNVIREANPLYDRELEL